MVATVADRVIVELEARVAKYQRDVGVAVKRFDDGMRRIEGSAGRMESRVEGSFARAGAAIRRQVGIIAGALGAREVGLYADAWTEAGNKIAAAGQISGIQGDTLAKLSQRAIEARTAFEPYIDLYTRLLRTAGQVGATTREVATATDIVAQSFKAGGAAAQEQSAGILQLGQALGSGFLQGDELRSLRENAPLLANAIADEFKTTIGGLKKLGEEGKLTSDRVFRAILAGQGDIEAAFKTTQSTIGDGFQNLRTAIIRYVGDADDAIGATDALIGAMNALAKNLDVVAIAFGALAIRGLTPLIVALGVRLAGAARTAVAALQLLAVTGGASFVAMNALRGSIALLGGPVGAAIIAATGLAYALTQIGEDSVTAEDGLARLQKSTNQAKTSINDLAGVEKAIKEDTDRLKRANDALNEAVRTGGEVAIATANQDVAAINRRIQGNERLKEAILATLKAQQAALKADAVIARSAFEAEFVPKAITKPGGFARRAGGQAGVDFSQAGIAKRTAAALDEYREAALAANEAGNTTEAQANFFALEAKILTAEDAARSLGETIDEVLSGTPAQAEAPGVAPPGAAGSGGKTKKNAFETELKSLKERSSEAAAVIALQGSLNPLIDDYASSLASAALAAELLHKANEAGIAVDEEKIRNLAESVVLLEKQADAARGFGSTVDGIRAVTAELRGQTEVLARIDPLMEDYGFSLAAAEAEQQLLSEAMLAGIEITDELAAAIRQLAEEYGGAVAEGNKLSDAQERLKEGNKEFRDTAKSAMSGFIADIRSGESAVASLGKALQKIADRLLSLALDNLTSSKGPLGTSGGGGILGIVSTLFTSFAAKGGVFAGGRELPRFAGGGVSDRAAIFAEAGPEAAVPLPDGRRIPVDLRVPEMRQPAQEASAGGDMINLGGLHIHGVSNVDEFRQSSPQLLAGMGRMIDQAKDRRTA